MKYGLSCLLQLLCFLLHSGLTKFGWATMYDDDDSAGFLKRIMLREVKQDCDEGKIMNYLARLQAINPESIINLAAVKHLKDLCSDLDIDIKEINDYLSTCTPANQKNLYYSLIKGINALNNKLCKDKQFQEDFTKYCACFESLNEEYQLCIGPEDWTENPNDEEVCKVYGHILQCYKEATKRTCGEKAANIMEQFMKNVINSILTVRCELADVSKVANVLQENQPAVKGKSTTAFSLIPLFVILSLIIFIIIVYTTNKCMTKKTEEKN